MDSFLSKKKCIPCEGGVKALTFDELEDYKNEVPDWEIMDDGKSIKKRLKFSNFVKSLEFVNKVALIAEEENHHPDIEFGWGYCVITMQTHSVGGLHENDFIVASKINEIN